MSLQAIALTDFTAGELSPKLSGRFDNPIYARGCMTLENWVPFSAGGITTRPGSKYIGLTKSGGQAVIVPFIVDSGDAYILEFSPLILRIWHNDAVVSLFAGPSSEHATSYSSIAHCRELRFAQDGNKLYVCHKGYAPAVVTWSGTVFDFTSVGMVYNVGQQPFSGAGYYPGTVACFAGRLWFAGSTLEPQTIYASRSFIYTSGDPWVASTPYEIGQIVSNDSGKLYRCVAKGTSAGSGGPTGTGSSIADGTCMWNYWCAAGLVDMTYFDTVSYTTTTVTSPSATGTAWANSTAYVVGDIRKNGTRDYQCIFSGTSAASPATGPSGTDDNITDGTCRWKYLSGWADPDVPETKVTTTYKDVIAEDHAMRITIASDQLDAIVSLIAGKALIVGTVSSEYVIDAGITALAPKVQLQSRYGAEGVQGTLVNDAIIFLQGYATRLREYQYASDAEAFKSPDLTFQADHILQGSSGTAYAIDLDFALVPEPMIYLVRSDGQLAVLLNNPLVGTQAWHRYTSGAGGLYESVAVVSGTYEDAVYAVVNRGTGYRCIEKFDRIGCDQAVSATVPPPLDSWVYVSTAGATVTGLERFNTKSVAIYDKDALTYTTGTVSGGSLSIPAAYQGKNVYIGAVFTATMQTERVTTQGPYGTAQMRNKRIGSVYVRVLASYAFKIGYVNTAALLETAVFPGASPYSGDLQCGFQGSWTTDAWVMAIQDQPYRVTILALIPEVEG